MEPDQVIRIERMTMRLPVVVFALLFKLVAHSLSCIFVCCLQTISKVSNIIIVAVWLVSVLVCQTRHLLAFVLDGQTSDRKGNSQWLDECLNYMLNIGVGDDFPILTAYP